VLVIGWAHRAALLLGLRAAALFGAALGTLGPRWLRGNA
jgi:hypothetical protein